jgi:hypothetical protein
MAQINHNISTPNDGLGDQLRTGFSNQNTMNTELYETKVDKVLGKGLTKNEFTDAEKKASRNCYKCRSKRSKRLQADNNG